MTNTGHRWIWPLIVLAAITLMLLSRVCGPGDLPDQSQPRTVSYTVDVVENGRWILPRETGDLPATKPPGYNWLAAPFVAVLGIDSELAHKLPSIIAFLVCTMLLVGSGNRLQPGMGWLAALMFTACYPIFKLAYLARPDMMLCGALLVMWLGMSYLLIDDRRLTDTRRICVQGVTWLACAAALLIKGPIAIAIALPFALIAGKIFRGSLRGAFKSVALIPGLVFALAIFAVWVMWAWMIDAEHVRGRMLSTELFGRIVGTGSEAQGNSLLSLLTGLGDMPGYFLVRFFPWSLFSVVAMFQLWQRRKRHPQDEGAEHPSRSRAWMISASIWVIVTIAMTSLIAVKRADYIAPAYGPAALLAGWWWLSRNQCERDAQRRSRAYGPGVIATCVLAVLVLSNQREWSSPYAGYGDSVERFTRQAKQTIKHDPTLPLIAWRVNGSYVPAFLGIMRKHNTDAMHHLFSNESGAFWLLTIHRPEQTKPLAEEHFVTANPPRPIELFIAAGEADRALPRQGEHRLYRVGPRD